MDVRDLLRAPALEVAPRLLGWTVRHETAEGAVAVELTEVEAYEGGSDPASHAHRGETARNRVMFGEAGHLYVYLSYGVHWCGNVVTGQEGTASAVLLRAGRVVEGRELARSRRGERVRDRDLARGPGRLGQALGLGPQLGGADLLGGGPITLVPGDAVGAGRVRSGHRVGVGRAHDLPWRFWVADEPTVSAYRRSPRAK